jgi:hypothetical protein
MKKKTKKKPEAPPTVESVLRILEPDKFMLALSSLDMGHNGIPFYERPEPLATMGGLYALWIAVENGGLRQFIDQSDGAAFHETEASCRQIGADRAAEYLAEAANLFPDGRVPVDDDERFDIAVEYEPTSPLDPPDPFQALDRNYADAMSQLVERMRTFVTTNEAEIASALAMAPEGTGEMSQTDMDAALAALEKMAEEMGEPVPSRLDPAAGKPDTAASVARITRFVDGLTGVTPANLVVACERYAAMKKKDRDRAQEEVDAVMFDGSTKNIEPLKHWTKVSDAARIERDRLKPVIMAVPESETVGADKVPMRSVAKAAVLLAWQALMTHDWLILRDGGKDALALACAPFRGLAPIPGDS